MVVEYICRDEFRWQGRAVVEEVDEYVAAVEAFFLGGCTVVGFSSSVSIGLKGIYQDMGWGSYQFP